MLGLILGIIIIGVLNSILQELRSIKKLLIESNIQVRESTQSLSVDEEEWVETSDICPACGNELDPESNVCLICGLEFEED